MGRLAHELAAVAPSRTEGNDATGFVHLVLGADGVPAEIRVRDRWAQHLPPSRLGAAVLEANADAVRRALRMWTDALDDSGWPAPAADPVDPPLPAGRDRDVNVVAEEAIAALEKARAEPDVPEGSDDGRHVTVRVGAGGLVACVVDADWAQNRDGASLTAALATALGRATAQRAARSETGPAADALATLTAITRPTEGGER
ncbi:hypothetical protein KOI35_14965 [Actinoplanes bogorensis]|uniref:YbaB/EbfC DNA-binding family protein n=1 Tax=Paractinoplanes bogorensis TaxID=1610840 RepID=A0ABS5YNB2_9ACTN|nr:hypothetical protein [Actinoplanes bogorensis]MBU2664801.1 hypothetical protein [Actinoplanes bogorensis]